MKQVKVLSEKSEYKNGKRIATVCTETTTSLADDMAEIANYQGSMASHQAQIERLIDKMPSDEIESRPFHDEITRLKSEMEILKQAIAIQEKFIKGFDENAD